MKKVDVGMSADYISVGMCWGKNEDNDILLRSMGYPVIITSFHQNS